MNMQAAWAKVTGTTVKTQPGVITFTISEGNGNQKILVSDKKINNSLVRFAETCERCGEKDILFVKNGLALCSHCIG